MLALIAGQGKLPSVLVDALKDMPYIVSLEGFDPDILVPDRRFRIEHLGTLILELQALGVDQICLAGSIARPALDPTRIDAATVPMIPRMMQALQMGDDGALREVLAIFEDAGFRVRAADELSAGLLPAAGVHTSRRTEDHHKADAARGAEVVAAMGATDIGQACVIKAGQAIAIEGQFGTEWMLRSLTQRPDGEGGLLYKAKKPGQDARVDLPVIGVDTVGQAARAGLEGIVVEESGVMVLDLAAVTRAADEQGLFLWVRRP